jgi:hypothetical protein
MIVARIGGRQRSVFRQSGTGSQGLSSMGSRARSRAQGQFLAMRGFMRRLANSFAVKTGCRAPPASDPCLADSISHNEPPLHSEQQTEVSMECEAKWPFSEGSSRCSHERRTGSLLPRTARIAMPGKMTHELAPALFRWLAPANFAPHSALRRASGTGSAGENPRTRCRRAWVRGSGDGECRAAPSHGALRLHCQEKFVALVTKCTAVGMLR